MPLDAVKFAEDWYNEQEIYRFIQDQVRVSFLNPVEDPMPRDISSMEFAAWWTKHLRRAMAKGIQIAQQELRE
jgi:hypothetical protein